VRPRDQVGSEAAAVDGGSNGEEVRRESGRGPTPIGKNGEVELYCKKYFRNSYCNSKEWLYVAAELNAVVQGIGGLGRRGFASAYTVSTPCGGSARTGDESLSGAEARSRSGTFMTTGGGRPCCMGDLGGRNPTKRLGASGTGPCVEAPVPSVSVGPD